MEHKTRILQKKDKRLFGVRCVRDNKLRAAAGEREGVRAREDEQTP